MHVYVRYSRSSWRCVHLVTLLAFTHVQSALQNFATHCLLLSNQPLKEMILCFYSLEKSEMFLNLETLQTCCQVKHFDYWALDVYMQRSQTCFWNTNVWMPLHELTKYQTKWHDIYFQERPHQHSVIYWPLGLIHLYLMQWLSYIFKCPNIIVPLWENMN